MQYNLSKIGKRLKKERKQAGFKSHESLRDYIQESCQRCVSRQTIAKWESGECKELPPLEIMLELCNKYDCELGYLLCEYDCKTRDDSDLIKHGEIKLEVSVERINEYVEKAKKYVDLLKEAEAMAKELSSVNCQICFEEK